jgi:hypothetical protein
MKILFTLLIFFIILFFYIHILFQLKTSNESEIYELILPSKEKLEKILTLKQPFLFTIENKDIFNKISDLKSNPITLRHRPAQLAMFHEHYYLTSLFAPC